MTDEILMKFLLNESSEEEKELVKRWLTAAEENQKHFIQLKSIWELSGTLAGQTKQDKDAAWERFKVKRAELQEANTNAKRFWSTLGWLKVAAILLITVGIWFTYNWLGPNSFTSLQARNQIHTEILPDGSVITLNKEAKISYARYFKNNRKLKVENGDVFFEVAKDKAHPFVIDVDRVTVEVVGTAFNISQANHVTEVNVESGIVKVKLGQSEIKLYKGEKITINGRTKKLAKVQSQDQLYNYYKTGLIQSNNTPLSKLIQTLNKAYGSNITLDAAVIDSGITTTIKIESLERDLKLICLTMNLKQTRNGNHILLSNP